MTNQRLKKYGPWAVVTGASDGIGRAFAEHLASVGLNLVLVARREQALTALATELQSAHRTQTIVAPADLSLSADRQRLLDVTAALDCGLLVAAAGYGTSGDFFHASLETEASMLEVNCRAVMEQTHAFANRFKARGGGGIILFGSLVGWQGTPHAAHYAATKAYIQTLVEGIYAELRRQHVDILSCAPGPVASGFAARAGMTMSLAERPHNIVVTTLHALGRRRTVVPGAISKLLTYSLAPLPRFLRTAIIGQVMAGMTH